MTLKVDPLYVSGVNAADPGWANGGLPGPQRPRGHLTMKYLVTFLELVILVSVQCGYLDQLVSYYRNNFINDVKAHTTMPRIMIQDPPPGYRDDEAAWDFKSARRLLVMIKRSGQYDQLTSNLPKLVPKSGRRQQKVWDDRNDIYYDSDEYISIESSDDDEHPRVYTPEPIKHKYEDNQIVYISNPVEARLPGHSISIKLLRKILTARAIAGKKLDIPSTSTTRKTRTTCTTVKANATTVSGNTTMAKGTDAPDSGLNTTDTAPKNSDSDMNTGATETKAEAAPTTPSL